MSLVNFVKKMITRIDRPAISEDNRVTRNELSSFVQPSVAAMVEYFNTAKMKSALVKTVNEEFQVSMPRNGLPKKANFIQEIDQRIPNLLANLETVSEYVTKHIESTVLKDGLTARQLAAIRASANLSFISRFTMSLLNFIYVEEAKANDNGIDKDLLLMKAEYSYINKYIRVYAALVGALGVPPKVFKEKLDRTPDVYLNQETAEAVKGIYDLDEDEDPVGFVSGFIGNPIYRVRLVIANWQNDRYESSQEKKKQLELRLMYLKMQAEGQKDPVLEKQISRLQSRIDAYEEQLRETEEKLGLNEV